ncbi:type VII secretion-associated protein [Corynebacterium kalidii]|uniref:Type VII secretion-associated protein n=1 Tax=Corynebacterium kalidii TaxID=2931982 RepID=A0A9X1WFX6_9CORY|nr:type VII secretion-associated protein [Corynebacterium kalidii]MCJ7857900.1 type VII secretion-associated protein [Corynebacterium kalidii]
MNAGMVASAVALTESGILVNGLCATDLLSGFEVRCADSPDSPDSPDASDASAGGPVFRGSGVPLLQLEAVRELVEEVLEAREADPELTSANPVVPRTVFPWGIGASVSDILVAGPDKDVTAAYLRMTGLRARTVDVSQALRLAGDLAEARAEVADPDPAGAGEQAGEEAGEEIRDQVGEQDRAESVVGSRSRGTRPSVPPRVVVLAAVALVSVVLVGLVAGVLARGPGDSAHPVEAGGGVQDGREQPEATEATEDGDDVPEDPSWRELSADGTGPEEAGGARHVTVTVDVPGWRMSETTPDSEIWTSGDDGMRVLIAASPTPVGTQDELDAAMLRALDGLDGPGADGGVVVTGRSPVAYEEHFPDSTTSWRVLLVDGHQVSVGCQYREFSEDRRETCGRFGATVRVSAAAG